MCNWDFSLLNGWHKICISFIILLCDRKRRHILQRQLSIFMKLLCLPRRWDLSRLDTTSTNLSKQNISREPYNINWNPSPQRPTWLAKCHHFSFYSIHLMIYWSKQMYIQWVFFGKILQLPWLLDSDSKNCVSVE